MKWWLISLVVASAIVIASITMLVMQGETTNNMELINQQKLDGITKDVASDYLKFLYSDVGLTHSCSYYNIINPLTSPVLVSGNNLLKTSSTTSIKGEIKDGYWEIKMNITKEEEYIPPMDCKPTELGIYDDVWCENTNKPIKRNVTTEEWTKLGNSISFNSKETKSVRYCADHTFSKDNGIASVEIDHIPEFMGNVYDKLAWWNGTWNYKREINFTNNAQVTLTDYQYMMYLDNLTNMNPDLSDIRFVDSLEEYEYDFWIENYTSVNSTIWIQINKSVTSGSIEQVFMYYGNSTPVNSKSNGFLTFPLFDDFNDGSLNTTKWLSAGSPVETQGTITLENGASAEYIRTQNAQNFSYNYALRSRWYMLATPNSGTAGIVQFGTFANLNSICQYSCYKPAGAELWWRRSGDNTGNVETTDTPPVMDKFFNTYEIRRNSTIDVEFVKNDTLQQAIHYVEVGTLNIYAGAYNDRSTKNQTLDWILVRQYYEGEPTYVIYPEQVYVPPAGDTCTYTLGNWEVDCSDNCTLESNVDLNGNNISFVNIGTITITANISNAENIFIDATNGCEVVLLGGSI